MLLAAAAGATSALTGSILLIAFVIGLIASNTVITVASTLGLIGSGRHRALHTVVGAIVAVFSLTLGTMFVLGIADQLPVFFV